MVNGLCLMLISSLEAPFVCNQVVVQRRVKPRVTRNMPLVSPNGLFVYYGWVYAVREKNHGPH